MNKKITALLLTFLIFSVSLIGVTALQTSLLIQIKTPMRSANIK
jgi:hypothetical protein